ncbi:MAG TPA: hypothetical protein VME63_08240 [Dyella sp.]|uniref:hypothetical protein n=1 Tax=Dyella sp. TaxID=1869338 RepID=UPI002C0A6304|nr:hypothetical protein [Dyella sp.]HTV85381.1 hypothetical protein [Dyella sp.]
MMQTRLSRVPTLAVLTCAMLGLWSAKSFASVAIGGTTLEVTNASSQPVPVMVTLGIGHFGVTNIDQLHWHIIPQPKGSATQGIFMLPAHKSVIFDSGSKSFSGNIAFGPTFTARGQGNKDSKACYPDATNLAEFTLNQQGETVDISRVNGANAKIAIDFKGGSPWNDGVDEHKNILHIADEQPISTWTSPVGVYGWQATDCVDVKLPVPNGPPSNLAPAPVNAPNGPQLQATRQCNIQRAGNARTGGIVHVVFNGWDTGAAPMCDERRAVADAKPD